MDGYITQANPMKKPKDEDSATFLEEIEDEEANSEKDETVRLFKQKIRQLEKAVKAGQLDIGEQQNESGGVWVNNLNSVGSKRGKVISPVDEGEGEGKGEVKELKRLTTSALPLGGRGRGPDIVMPAPLAGYEESQEALIEQEKKMYNNEDNVLQQITSKVDLSAPSSPSSSSAREEMDSEVKPTDPASESVESPTRVMLNHQRGYQMKKIENMQAGYRKKVSDIDARMEELREAIAKRELTSNTAGRK